MVDINIDGQYQINGVSIVGSPNPSIIAFSATDGIVVTGTTAVTASRILTIPANTFTTNGMLEIAVGYSKGGAGGSCLSAIYLNTSPTLTGATQIAQISSTTNNLNQGIRTARINSNTLTIWPLSTITFLDYAANANPLVSVTFNTAVDNYLIFAASLVSATDTAVVEMARAVKYLEV